MTSEEAIEAIKMAVSQVEWEYPLDYAAAFDMAIEALKNSQSGFLLVRGYQKITTGI